MLLRSRDQLILAFDNVRPRLGTILLVSLILCFVFIGGLQQRSAREASAATLSIGLTTSHSAETSPPLAQDGSEINLQIDFDNQLFWNGQSITLRELRQRVNRISVYAPEAVVNVKAHRLASFNEVFETLKTTQNAGVRYIVVSHEDH